ncbi:MAG: tetratricopeptide repeat protein, partial [Acidobacteria bacterium]|nr:tetratricopeptide repeat protein [Acidobacteriota bacterium]
RTATISPSPSIIPVPSQSPALVEIIPSPPKTAATPAINRRQPSIQGIVPKNEIAVLKDGGTEVRIDKSGMIIGAGALPPDLQRLIKETLLAENIKKPAVLDEVDSEQGPLRGIESGKSRFRLLSPGRTVISEQQPTFKWEPLEGVSGYEVIVGDSFGRMSANSGHLPADATQWTSAAPLKRGEVYSWVVEATINGERIITPVPPDREMKFKVLDEKSARRLEALKKNTSSHLALGMFYAREGMIEEAEREFQQLLNDNPNSPIAAALLRSVHSWR